MESARMTVRNWGGELNTVPKQVLTSVSSREELIDIVRNPTRYPSPLRAVGSRHSTTRCFEADHGTLIDMRSMNAFIGVDGEAGEMTVTAGAGMLYIDLSRELNNRGLMHHVNTEIGNLTLGAAVVAQTKDASFSGGYGNVGSYVCGVRMITADGEDLQVSEESNPELMHLIRGSFGLLGIVYEVTMRVLPLRLMRLYHVAFTLDGFLEKFKELRETDQSMMMYYMPHIDRIVVEFRSYPEDAPYIPDRDCPNLALKDYGTSWQYRIRNFAWATAVPFMTSCLNRLCLWRPMRNFILDNIFGYVSISLLNMFTGSLVLPGSQTIRYKEDGLDMAKYTFSIFSFKEENYPDVLRAYFKFVKEYERSTGWRCNMLNVGYVINKDETSYLSYTPESTGVTIDPVVSPDEGWYPFLEAYNKFCSEHDGTPLINQTPCLTPSQCEKAFGPKLEKFNKRRKKMDPENRFLNTFFKDLFNF